MRDYTILKRDGKRDHDQQIGATASATVSRSTRS